MKGLTDEETAAVLERNGVGVVALQGDRYPYQLPMCYGYVADSEVFVLQLTGGEDSRKKQLLRQSRDASVVVYEETEPGKRWRSVVVKGALRGTDYADAEQAFAALASRSRSVPNPLSWAESPDQTELEPYEVDIQEWSGREFEVL